MFLAVFNKGSLFDIKRGSAIDEVCFSEARWGGEEGGEGEERVKGRKDQRGEGRRGGGGAGEKGRGRGEGEGQGMGGNGRGGRAGGAGVGIGRNRFASVHILEGHLDGVAQLSKVPGRVIFRSAHLSFQPEVGYFSWCTFCLFSVRARCRRSGSTTS